MVEGLLVYCRICVFFRVQMIPLFGDRDFLEDQHILLAVRARDGDNESYGEK